VSPLLNKEIVIAIDATRCTNYHCSSIEVNNRIFWKFWREKLEAKRHIGFFKYHYNQTIPILLHISYTEK